MEIRNVERYTKLTATHKELGNIWEQYKDPSEPSAAPLVKFNGQPYAITAHSLPYLAEQWGWGAEEDAAYHHDQAQKESKENMVSDTIMKTVIQYNHAFHNNDYELMESYACVIVGKIEMAEVLGYRVVMDSVDGEYSVIGVCLASKMKGAEDQNET